MEIRGSLAARRWLTIGTDGRTLVTGRAMLCSSCDADDDGSGLLAAADSGAASGAAHAAGTIGPRPASRLRPTSAALEVFGRLPPGHLAHTRQHMSQSGKTTLKRSRFNQMFTATAVCS
jgi:hypothetical protein